MNKNVLYREISIMPGGLLQLVSYGSKDLYLTTRKQGEIIAKGENSSLISKLYKKTISVFIRESGF